MIGTLDSTKREVTIVGAGIAGMLAAYALDKRGYEVTLLEERERAGGLIQTERTQYGMAERAAHSLLATPAVIEFCRELGIELAEIRPDSRARFIVRDGRLRKFPLGAGEALTALGRAALARAGAGEAGMDLDAWGRRHLGDSAVEYLLTPFVRGIYGTQPAELGVGAAFPSLSVAHGRTLVGSMLGKAFSRRAKKGNGNGDGFGAHDEARVEKSGARKKDGKKRMVAPLHGMGDVTTRLERRLEERLGARFRKGVRVDEIPDAPNVIICTPAYAAAELLERDALTLSRALRDVRYTPIVSVTAFVPVAALTRPVKGVGALVPAKEGRRSLGILFTSSSFQGRVTDDGRYVSFAVLLGGTSQPEWVTASDEEIGDAVRAELASLLGIRGAPLRIVISRWPRAIPQYSVTLPDIWRRAEETWCAAPGRMLFGNYTGQVSLRGMIESCSRLG
jgi:oxygen-dependent protoporphyrinogen oxidase